MKPYKCNLIILLTFLVTLIIIGCEKNTPSNTPLTESAIDLSQVLSYYNSYVGDISAIGNIIANLPGHEYINGFELQTTSTPYGITVNYTLFEAVNTYLEDGTIISNPLSEIPLKNALILFSLIQNVDLIHFKLEPGYLVTYNRTDLVKAYEETHRHPFEQVITNTSTLKTFISSDFY